MAAVDAKSHPSLSEQYILKEKEEKSNVAIEPAEVDMAKTPVSAALEEVAPKTDEAPVVESSPVVPAAAEENSAASDTDAAVSNESTSAVEVASGDKPATSEESNQGAEDDGTGGQETAEETPEIKLETAPADFRFPTTNQTRHCFTRYVEYHRCTAAKGDSAPECDKFAKYYRSLCPGEWIERWNEQRENGAFPGPL